MDTEVYINRFLQQYAEENETIEVRSYSGRGMYGDNCLGIVGGLDDCFGAIRECILDTITQIDEAHHHEQDGFGSRVINARRTVENLLSDIRWDSMGLQYVVYFPDIGYEEPECDDSDNDEDE